MEAAGLRLCAQSDTTWLGHRAIAIELRADAFAVWPGYIQVVLTALLSV